MSTTAERVKAMGEVVASIGASIVTLAPTSQARQVGALLGLFAEYVSNTADAAIEVRTGHPDAEILGGMLSEWLAANAGADLAVLLLSPVILDIALTVALSFSAPVAVAVAFGLVAGAAFGGAYVGDKTGAFLWDKLVSALHHAFHDPLVLDLGGNGIELSSLAASSVHFDFSGDGFAEHTAWIGANDGILAIDDNGNGLVDNGLELFGSSTQDGFAVLETLDTNRDGKIDSADADFGKLRVWRDLNQNGVSDAGELQTLAQVGIASISLERHQVGGTNAGNTVGYEGSFVRTDGTTQVVQSIYLQIDQRHPAPDEGDFTPAAGVVALPQFAGSGLIHSIAYKATGLLADHGIAISMDGKGAWRDNVFVERLWRSVKYEEVYLRAYETVGEARSSIGRYLDFYNGRRPYSSLDDQAYFDLPSLRAAA
jgi:hypothetical protein